MGGAIAAKRSAPSQANDCATAATRPLTATARSCGPGPAPEIRPPAEGIEKAGAASPRDLHRHRVHGEVAAREVVLDGSRTNARERAGPVVAFPPRGRHVQALPRKILHHRRPEATVELDASSEPPRELAGEPGRVRFHDQVHVGSNTNTLDGIGAVGLGAHTPHEHLFTNRIADRTALLAKLVAAI